MRKYFLTIVLVLIHFFVFTQTNNEYYLIAGTYSSAKSEGIYVYKFNPATGENKFISTAKTSNPSFLSVSPNEKFIYAVNENADSTRFTVTGYIASFSFDKKNGTLNFINKQESGGKHPCYVSVDKSSKWVFTGNYSSGSATVLPVNADGSLGIATQTMQHEGSSVVQGRQDEPHVHATVLSKDNKTLYVPDLGLDKLMLYSFNNKTGKLSEHPMPFVATEPGAGPRHFDIHPNGKFAYLIEELTGSVSVFQVCPPTVIGTVA